MISHGYDAIVGRIEYERQAQNGAGYFGSVQPTVIGWTGRDGYKTWLVRR